MLGLCIYRERLEDENYTIQTPDGISCVIYAATNLDLGPLLFSKSQTPPYLIMAYESSRKYSNTRMLIIQSNMRNAKWES